jgi:hypothetical protein
VREGGENEKKTTKTTKQKKKRGYTGQPHSLPGLARPEQKDSKVLVAETDQGLGNVIGLHRGLFALTHRRINLLKILF